MTVIYGAVTRWRGIAGLGISLGINVSEFQKPLIRSPLGNVRGKAIHFKIIKHLNISQQL